MTRIAILPYRKLGFARVFGFTVRDLMMLRVLADMPEVEHIDWFERPGLPHEFFRDRLKGVPDVGPKITVHDRLDTGVIGALRQRRVWTQQAMERHEAALRRWADEAGPDAILLDFSPFYRPPSDIVGRVHYWYDLIDTFTKHNRFSAEEKAAVARKYAFTKDHAELVTGVTPAAVRDFGGRVLANRLLRETLGEPGRTPEFDLGFIGFVTDKFDLGAIRAFAAQGLSILICGHAYDPAVIAELAKIEGVTYNGPFTASDVPTLISQFLVGMVPYRPELSHDESPIKFFQYIAHGRPAVLSSHFNDIEKDFAGAVCYYSRHDTSAVRDFVVGWRTNFTMRSRDLQYRARQHPELFWEGELAEILSKFRAGRA